MSSADVRGRFVWHELMTSDTDAAGAFYSKVAAWKTQDSGMPSYTLWMAGDRRAAGLMSLPEQDSSATPPHWIIYIGTPDVDATAAAAEKLGGRILKPAADIPNVGRFAVLSDPQGAAFAIFSPQSGSGEAAPPGGEVGDFTWHELATTDPESAFNFYSELFGWAKGAAHDMGEMGVYQLLSHGGSDVGGIFKARDNSTPPNWLSYVRVSDVSKAANAAKGAGGRLLNGPMEVPGGSWIAHLLDPQGGAFALVEAPKPKVAAAPATKAPARKAPVKAAPAPAETIPAAAPAKKSAARKSVASSAAARKAPARKTTAKKAAAKKAPAKKAAARKAAATKAAATKAAATKAAATKAPAGKSAARSKLVRGKKAEPAKRPGMAKTKRTASKSAKRSAARPTRGQPGGKARKHR